MNVHTIRLCAQMPNEVNTPSSGLSSNAATGWGGGRGVSPAVVSGMTAGQVLHDAETGTEGHGDAGKLQDLIRLYRALNGTIPPPSLILQMSKDFHATGASRGNEVERNARVSDMIDAGLGVPITPPNSKEGGEELTRRLLHAIDELIASEAMGSESKIQDDVDNVRDVGDWSENGAQVFFWGHRYRTLRILSRNMSSMSEKRAAILRAWGNVGVFDELYRLTREPSFNYHSASVEHSLMNFGLPNLILAVSPTNAALRLYVDARVDGVKWALRKVKGTGVAKPTLAEQLLKRSRETGRRFVVEIVQKGDDGERHYSVLLCRGNHVQAVDVLHGSVADKVGSVFQQLGFEVSFEYLGWTWIHRYDARRTVHAPERMGDRGACGYIAAFVALEFALAGKSLDDLRSYVKGPNGKRDAHRQMAILGQIIAHFIGMDVALRYDALPSEVDHIRTVQRARDPPVPGPMVPEIPANLAGKKRDVVRRAGPPEIERPAVGWSKAGIHKPSRTPPADSVGGAIGAFRSGPTANVVSGAAPDSESPVEIAERDPYEIAASDLTTPRSSLMDDATDAVSSGSEDATEAAERARSPFEGSRAHRAKRSGSNASYTGAPSEESDASDHLAPDAVIQAELTRLTGVNPAGDLDANPAQGAGNGDDPTIPPGGGDTLAPSTSPPNVPKGFIWLKGNEHPHQKMFTVVLNSLLHIDGLVQLVRTEDARPSPNFESAIGTLKYAVDAIDNSSDLSIQYVNKTETNFWVNGNERDAVTNLVNVIRECSKTSRNAREWTELNNLCMAGKARCAHCGSEWDIQKRSVTHLTVRRGATKARSGKYVLNVQEFINHAHEGDFTMFDTECDACMAINSADVKWSFKRTPRALLIDLNNYDVSAGRPCRQYAFIEESVGTSGIYKPCGWYTNDKTVRNQFEAPGTLVLPMESGAERSYALKSIICIYNGNLLWCSVKGGIRNYNRTINTGAPVVDLVAVYEHDGDHAVPERECMEVTDDGEEPKYTDGVADLPNINRRGLRRDSTSICFVNSAIQCIISTPAIQRMAYKLANADEYGSFKERITGSIETWKTHAKIFKNIPTEFRLSVMVDLLLWDGKDAAAIFATPFLHFPIYNGGQQDSESFLLDYLMTNSSLHARVRRNPIINSLITFNRVFGSQCGSCGNSYDYDNGPETTLPLIVGNYNMQIQDLISDERQLHRTTCTTCNTTQEGPCKVKFSRAPKVLIIRLDRFHNDARMKNETALYSDDTLKILLNASEVHYKLYSVICHYGITTGHYVAYVRDGSLWKLIDDDKIYTKPIDDKNSYMLFYEKFDG